MEPVQQIKTTCQVSEFIAQTIIFVGQTPVQNDFRRHMGMTQEYPR